MKPIRLLRCTFFLTATVSLVLASQGRSQVVMNSMSLGLSQNVSSRLVDGAHDFRSITSPAMTDYDFSINPRTYKSVTQRVESVGRPSTALLSELDLLKQPSPAISMLLTAEVLPESPSYALVMAALTFLGVVYVRSHQKV